MLLLTADDVRKALPMEEAIEAMKRAYASLSGGAAVVPLRTRLSIPGSEALSLFMPAFVGSQAGDSLAVKVVSLFPTNPSRGLAYIQAAVLALDADSGRAIALLEGSSLTAIRTGAGSGAAIDLLARQDSKVAAIFGAGAQGRTQLEAACTARKIETVFIYDPNPDKAQAFAAEMIDHSVPLTPAPPVAATKEYGHYLVRVGGCVDCHCHHAATLITDLQPRVNAAPATNPPSVLASVRTVQPGQELRPPIV